ncbi:ATP-dependent helicase [Candidatus Saganbacteria bacterium]|nr:ATP-dependent helicase [Candidatus Saganbacteria bacterium]
MFLTNKLENLTGLNPEQIAAVTHDRGPLLVVAGAGTGKTRVIIQRIAHLIKTKKAKPSEILALTFTDKAAQEMETRVDQQVPYGYIDVAISTFHAFGDRILRDQALDLGLRSDYRVLSAEEQLIFFREHLFDFPLHYYKSLGNPTKHIEVFLNLISRAQDENITPKAYLTWTTKKLKNVRTYDKEELLKQQEVAKIYAKYQELKLKHCFVDFADQVGMTLNIFRNKPAILKRYRDRYKYILVDEFQDTNFAQFELLKLLAGPRANLMVVGDDDQSIYKFRGAAISNILNFQKTYKKVKIIVLTKNYRSSQAILDTAYRLIRHNDPERLEVKAKINKKLLSQKKVGQKPTHNYFDRAATEADWVARMIKEKYEAGYKYNDFAILVRANADMEAIKQALNLLSIPHQGSGVGSFYQNPEVQLAVSFLKSIGDLSDSLALYQLAASDIYHLAPLDLQKLNTFAKRRNYTLHHVFSHLDDGGEEYSVLDDLKPKSRKIIQQIMADLNYYLELAKDHSTGEVLHRFLYRSNYINYLTHEENEANDRRLRNLAAFFDKLVIFKNVAELDRVAEFVKYLDLLRKSGDQGVEPNNFDPELDAVSILSVHKAKGLEFRVVFMVGLVVDKFPVRERYESLELPAGLLKEVIAANSHIAEERRLFYVGMTRAKEELFLSSAADYSLAISETTKRQRKISPFVLEALGMPRIDVPMKRTTSLGQISLFAPNEIVMPPVRKLRADEQLALSFSQVEDYLICPLKYKYVHILKIPLLPNHAIIYGQALHKAVQFYSQVKLNKKKVSLAAMIQELMHYWSAEGFISRQHEEQRLARAKEVLQRFYKREEKSKSQIKFVEEEFSIAHNNLTIRGRWDRVDESDGKIEIIDFKTSEVKDQMAADKRAKQSLQLGLYAAAWQVRFEKLPEKLKLYFLDSGLIGTTTKNAAEVAKVWETILQVAAGIREAEFPAKPNYYVCSFCAYNEICPYSKA